MARGGIGPLEGADDNGRAAVPATVRVHVRPRAGGLARGAARGPHGKRPLHRTQKRNHGAPSRSAVGLVPDCPSGDQEVRTQSEVLMTHRLLLAVGSALVLELCLGATGCARRPAAAPRAAPVAVQVGFPVEKEIADYAQFT